MGNCKNCKYWSHETKIMDIEIESGHGVCKRIPEYDTHAVPVNGGMWYAEVISDDCSDVAAHMRGEEESWMLELHTLPKFGCVEFQEK